MMRFLVTALLVLTASIAPSHASDTITRELKFEIGGVARRAILVNASTDQSLRPAVIVLHGGKGSAEMQRRRTGFDAIAVAEGFSVVYAEGTRWGRGFHAWNTGYLQRQQVGRSDDIGYFDRLIDLLVREHRVDPARVYMTGGSNGGMMTFVYAVNRPGRLAAIAPVVGAMFTFEKQPAVPVPILMINGAQDNEVPIEGGMSRNPQVRRAQLAPYKSLQSTVDFWISANRSLQTGNTVSEGTVRTTTYPAPEGGAVTISIVDSVGGHGWPGTRPDRTENTPIKAFDGAERVWAFFRTQRRTESAPP